MSTSIPYLQTLPKAEATAFVASLQKVKDHLTQELEWMTEQVQQKTTQLQGIETLLAEASELGLANLTLALIAKTEANSVTTSGTMTPVADLANDFVAQSATAGSNPKTTANSTKPKREAKPTAAGKVTVAKTKKTNTPSKSTGQASRASGSVDLRELLTSEFQGQTFTDSVAQILESIPQPIHLKELLARLYGKLSDSDYQRARISLAKVLSTGKSEGKWQALGQGMYTGKAKLSSN